MAMENGALTTGFAATMGMLEPGNAADLAVMSWRQIAYTYLDQASPVLDVVVLRGKASGVEIVLVVREPQYYRIES
jgi:5-methylthioadenosine/S-adenosylhomocysteine deaminase